MLVQDTGGPRVRLTDPIQSHLAADASDLAGSREFVLAELFNRPDGLTSYELELIGFATYSGSRIRTALPELARDGLVIAVPGKFRKARKFRAQVWAITIQGLEALEWAS